MPQRGSNITLTLAFPSSILKDSMIFVGLLFMSFSPLYLFSSFRQKSHHPFDTEGSISREIDTAGLLVFSYRYVSLAMGTFVVFYF